VYATGVDSRILTIQFVPEQQQWSFVSLFRGQSHDILSLVLLDKNTLLSGGITTDVCIYPLFNGRPKDQFGKKLTAKEKLRHVPPFPFK